MIFLTSTPPVKRRPDKEIVSLGKENGGGCQFAVSSLRLAVCRLRFAVLKR